MSNQQLTFDLAARPAFGRDDFWVSPSNQEAVALIDAWPAWPAPTVALFGGPGTGKSHLAQVWRDKSGAVEITCSDVVVDRIPRLIKHEAIVLEMGTHIPADEPALFHLLNLVVQDRCHMLITSLNSIGDLPVERADLRSRLRSIPSVELLPPDDTLLTAVMTKLFMDRQLRVDPAVLQYACTRIDRSLDAARVLTDALDRAALAQKRPITIPLVSRVLADLDVS